MTYNQTPKEKAKQLVDKFKPYSHFWVHDLGNQREYDSEQFENAKQCALICVDEIIDLAHFNTISYSNYADGEIVEYTERVYWQEVKKHIEEII